MHNMSEQIQEFTEKLRAGIDDSYIFFGDAIPKKKLHNALAAYAQLADDEVPVALIDNTFFGSAKEGAVITNTKIWTRNQGGGMQSVSWGDIKSVQFEEGGTSWLLINGGKFLQSNMPEKSSIRLLSSLLQEFCVTPGTGSVSDAERSQVELVDDVSHEPTGPVESVAQTFGQEKELALISKEQETSALPEEMPDKKNSFKIADGFIPGFIASAAALDLFFDGYASNQTGLLSLLPLVIFTFSCLAYFGVMSDGEGSHVIALEKSGYYKKTILVTVIANIVAIAATIGLYIFVLLAIAHGAITVKEGFMDRIVPFGLFMILPYLTYLAPGFIVAMLLREKGKK